MSDEELKNNLNELKKIAERVHTDANLGKKMLEKCGYNWFEGISGDFLKEEVKRVFYVAVNDVIHKKVEAVNTMMKLNQELLSLLERGISDKKPMQHYFRNPDSIKPPLTSPHDLAEYLRDDVPLDLVENLIQHQFDIRWSTPDEAPAKYTFYDFCGRTNTTNYFKYDPRRVHVTATLYRECCRKPERPKQTWYDLLDKPTKILCPTVYIKIDKGWMTWQPLEEGDKFSDGCVSLTDAGIDQSIQIFFDEHAKTQKSDPDSLLKSLTQPTIYFAVIQDTDFPSPDELDDNKLELNEIGKNQVYVGKALNGIRDRWINDSKSHCAMMMKCLKNVCAMTTYAPVLLKKILLVDARLALANVRKENTALFVIKTFDDLGEVKDAIEEIDSLLGNSSLDLSSLRNELPSATSKGDDQPAAERRRGDQEDVAKKQTENAKDAKTRKELDGFLSTAKNLYKRGTDKVAVGWRPTDMKYGMNCDNSQTN